MKILKIVYRKLKCNLFSNIFSDFNVSISVWCSCCILSNFSATQEIDRIQQTHISEIETLKTEVSTLKQENMQHKIEIETLKSENIELKEKLTELTNKIKNSTTFEDLKNSL